MFVIINCRKHKKARYVGDVSDTYTFTPRSGRRNWEMAKKNVIGLRKEVARLKQQSRRLKDRVKSFKTLMNYLKENHSITEDAQTSINVNCIKPLNSTLYY